MVLYILLMMPAAGLGLLAGGGVTQYLRQGGPLRRVLLRRTLDGFLTLPGAAVVAARLGGTSLPPAALLPVAFSASFVIVRLTSDVRDWRRRRAQRSSLPYETWYAMLQADHARASRFITAWFAQMDEGGRAAGRAPLAQLAELESACADLAREHASDPDLPAALSILQDRILQLEQRKGLTGPLAST
jgi:hypothetical protein